MAKVLNLNLVQPCVGMAEALHNKTEGFDMEGLKDPPECEVVLPAALLAESPATGLATSTLSRPSPALKEGWSRNLAMHAHATRIGFRW